MTDLLVQDVPAPVLKKLVADARRRDISLVEATVGILAKRFGIAREPSGVSFRGEPSRSTLLLSMPDDLHRALKIDAAGRAGVTMRGLIIESLALHYGVQLKHASPARRARGTATVT